MISPMELLAVIGAATLACGGVWVCKVAASGEMSSDSDDVESTIQASSEEVEKMQTYGELEKSRLSAIKIVGEMIEDLSMALQQDQATILGPWHLQNVITSLSAIRTQMLRTQSKFGAADVVMETVPEAEVATVVYELIGMRQLPQSYQVPTSIPELLFVACRLYRLVCVAMRNSTPGQVKPSYNLA